jgi:nitrile hydratase accessory protein
LSPPETGTANLPRDAADRVFAEPWEAQAFAMAVMLAEAGRFTWPEWTAALAAELAAGSEADDGTRYYHHWLAARERLVSAKGLVDGPSLAARKAAWEAAYRATPHGRPVELGPGAETG